MNAVVFSVNPAFMLYAKSRSSGRVFMNWETDTAELRLSLDSSLPPAPCFPSSNRVAQFFFFESPNHPQPIFSLKFFGVRSGLLIFPVHGSLLTPQLYSIFSFCKTNRKA